MSWAMWTGRTVATYEDRSEGAIVTLANCECRGQRLEVASAFAFASASSLAFWALRHMA